MSILKVQGLKKVYSSRLGSNQVEALRNVNFSVEQGEFVAVMGESGSGKTTLLNILAALDTPTAGSVQLDGRELGEIKEGDVAAFRRDNLGFVFQDFNLLDTFTIVPVGLPCWRCLSPLLPMLCRDMVTSCFASRSLA